MTVKHPSTSTGSRFRELTRADEFRDLVARADLPVMMVFNKTGCPTCVLLKPRLERLADEYQGRALFARYKHASAWMKVTSWRILKEFRVYLVPTVILFVGGQERKRWVLHYGIDSYRRALDEALGLPASSAQPADSESSALPAGEACAVVGDDGQLVDCPACRIDDASCGRPEIDKG
jgi:thioredoxin-like negative regulator of GroEL